MQMPTILGLFEPLKEHKVINKGDFVLKLNFYILSLDRFTSTVYITNFWFDMSIKTLNLVNLSEEISKKLWKIIFKDYILTEYAVNIKNADMAYLKNITFNTSPETLLNTLLENLDQIYKLIYINANLPTILENQVTKEIMEMLDNCICYVVKYDLSQAFYVFMESNNYY